MQTDYEGIVTAVKKSPDPRSNVYTIMSTRVVVAKSPLLLELGDCVEASTGEDGTLASAKVKGNASKKEIRGATRSAVGKLDIGRNIERVKSAYGDQPYGPALVKMSGALEGAATTLAGAYLSGAPIIVRFHHDGDGSSGAVSLHRALLKVSDMLLDGKRNVSWVMHRGVEYDSESFYSDSLELKNYESVEKPVVLITDFGTAPGSEAQISAITESSRLIMLDHHPTYEGFSKGSATAYINPWDYGSDTNFTAGLLTSIFAEAVCEVDTSDMRAASLISDFSSFADRSDKKGMRDAVILDYLTNVAGRAGSSIAKLVPSHIESILTSREKSDEIFYTASNAMNEMLDLGVKSVKSYKCRDGITAFVLEFGTMPKNDSGYPLPGRYSSRLQERLESINGDRTITLLYYGSYVTARLSKNISSEVGMLKIIGSIVDSSEYAESGGGHNEAASIRVSRDHAKEVVGMVLRMLGAAP